MIEARELRIGNYILDDEGRFVKVERIESPEFSEWNCSGDEPIIFSINGRMMMSEVIKPIPLTEEILLKCGFDQNGYCFFIPKISNIYFKKPFIEADYFLVKSIGGDKLTTAKHLHQLQNLYFALTGEELNVKI